AAAPPYAVVLMDIQMPELDGVETTRRVRAQFAATNRACPPVVAMTAYSMQGDAERFRSEGFDDYVSKPVTSHELFAAICRQAPDLAVEDIVLASPLRQAPPPSLTWRPTPPCSRSSRKLAAMTLSSSSSPISWPKQPPNSSKPPAIWPPAG
ncbi:MAG: response regulator, partial [Hymenobacteraceae bacterium]|nr:response regulator [Hymenobacteraceae bacterium]